MLSDPSIEELLSHRTLSRSAPSLPMELLRPYRPPVLPIPMPSELGYTFPHLALKSQKQENLADVAQMALAAKPPRANIVRVTQHTTWSGDEEIVVRYDRFTTGEKVALGVGAVAAGAVVVAAAAAIGIGLLAYAAAKAAEKKD